MAKTKVTWAQYAANVWRGCAEVHTGCRSCYAKAQSRRFPGTFGTWGPAGARIIADLDELFRQVAGWNRKAVGAEKSPIVFWNDVSDTFEDRSDLAEPRLRMFTEGIDPNQNLVHVLLTKRPQNVRWMWPEVSTEAITGRYVVNFGEELPETATTRRHNVWLLYSASDQATLDSGLPHLLACRDLVPVLGLSLEPLIGPIDLSDWWGNCATGPCSHTAGRPDFPMLDLVIVGGESGPHARQMPLDALESIAEQCTAALVPLWIKQDSARKPGQQGRIPDRLWTRKELPR